MYGSLQPDLFCFFGTVSILTVFLLHPPPSGDLDSSSQRQLQLIVHSLENDVAAKWSSVVAAHQQTFQSSASVLQESYQKLLVGNAVHSSGPELKVECSSEMATEAWWDALVWSLEDLSLAVRILSKQTLVNLETSTTYPSSSMGQAAAVSSQNGTHGSVSHREFCTRMDVSQRLFEFTVPNRLAVSPATLRSMIDMHALEAVDQNSSDCKFSASDGDVESGCPAVDERGEHSQDCAHDISSWMTRVRLKVVLNGQ